ncbi:MAG: hypothetical protein R3A79_16540 [Nannocystaceae bacterium]
MDSEDDTQQELWRGETLVAAAPRFAISELFRRQREAAATLELRLVDEHETRTIARIIGAPPDLQEAHRGGDPADEPAPALYYMCLDRLRDVHGEEHLWCLDIELSEDDAIVGFTQTLWDVAADRRLMEVTRDRGGEVLAVEKDFAVAELDFTIHYDGQSNVVDIVEYTHDEDWYMEDLAPRFDDPRFYADARALPSRFGPTATLPDVPPFPGF